MDPMRCLAIDPGKTVGWAVGWEVDGKPVVADWGELNYTDFSPGKLTIDLEITDVVVEQFTPRGQRLKAGHSIAIEVADHIKWQVDEIDGVNLHWQQPSDAKGVITDDRLKKMGLWIVGKPHARDAIRHLVIALRRAR